MDWLRSEDLKEEKGITNSVSIITSRRRVPSIFTAGVILLAQKSGSNVVTLESAIQHKEPTCQRPGSTTITPLVTTRRRPTISTRQQNITRPRSAKKPRITHTWLTATANRQFITHPKPPNFTLRGTTAGRNKAHGSTDY
jgi:hypothetical protein